MISTHCFRKIGVKKAANNKKYYTINLPTEIGFGSRTHVEVIPATYDGRRAAILVEVDNQPCDIVSKPYTTDIDDVLKKRDMCSLDMRHPSDTDNDLHTIRELNLGPVVSQITQPNGKAWEAQIIAPKPQPHSYPIFFYSF